MNTLYLFFLAGVSNQQKSIFFLLINSFITNWKLYLTKRKKFVISYPYSLKVWSFWVFYLCSWFQYIWISWAFPVVPIHFDYILNMTWPIILLAPSNNYQVDSKIYTLLYRFMSILMKTLSQIIKWEWFEIFHVCQHDLSNNYFKLKDFNPLYDYTLFLWAYLFHGHILKFEHALNMPYYMSICYIPCNDHVWYSLVIIVLLLYPRFEEEGVYCFTRVRVIP